MQTIMKSFYRKFVLVTKQRILGQNARSQENDSFLWIDNFAEDNCALVNIRVSLNTTKRVNVSPQIVTVGCHGLFHKGKSLPGLCVRNTFEGQSEKSPKNEDLSQAIPIAQVDFVYTCQCSRGFGMENCTKTSDDFKDLVDPGYTFCQSKESVANLEASPGVTDVMIVVDHVAYGKPFYMPGSTGETCPDSLYAKAQEEVRNI